MSLLRPSLPVFISLVIMLFATQSFAQPQDAVKPLTFMDRDLWLALPQTEIEAGEEIYNLTTLKAASNVATGKRLYLWIGEPAWPNNGDALVVKGLTQSGDVWYLDTPEALFIDRSRITMRGLDGQFVKDLVNLATRDYQEVIVITLDVGAVPVLRGLRSWQEQASETARNRFKNLVLLYPSLFVNAPVAGEVPEFYPITTHSALPITILQPEQGAQSNSIQLTDRRLRMGGSLVNTLQVPIATDGYFKYQDIRMMAKDAIQRIPAVVDQKIKRLQKLKYRVATMESIQLNSPESKIIAGMVKLKHPKPMPSFTLKSLDGQQIRVPEDYQGKALLVNFWATWCPHCVEEIPSMNRALDHLAPDRFAMISVSYKDTQPIMEAFVKDVKVSFPILMDFDGKVSEDWKVFAYPSSFLIDANGHIHYAINSGSIWDSPEMLSYLREVMQIPIQPKP
jgi:peroxiredoxin